MDAQQFVSEFLGSPQGAQAAQALSAQGVGDADAQSMLSQAAEATHGHVEEQSAGLLGDHAGRSFFTAFATGLVRGDGVLGSLKDGGEGVLTGRVAESLANSAGVNTGTASTIAAAATPFLVSFLKEKLG